MNPLYRLLEVTLQLLLIVLNRPSFAIVEGAAHTAGWGWRILMCSHTGAQWLISVHCVCLAGAWCREPAETWSLAMTSGSYLMHLRPLLHPLCLKQACTLLPHKVGVRIKQSFSWHPRASATVCELKDEQSLDMRGEITVLSNLAFFVK